MVRVLQASHAHPALELPRVDLARIICRVAVSGSGLTVVIGVPPSAARPQVIRRGPETGLEERALTDRSPAAVQAGYPVALIGNDEGPGWRKFFHALAAGPLQRDRIWCVSRGSEEAALAARPAPYRRP